MKIFANDYLSNLPGADRIGQGGPARFSSQLAETLGAAGHSYIGLVTRFSPTSEKIHVIRRAKRHRATYIEARIPKTPYERVTKARATLDPHVTLGFAIAWYREIIRNERPDIVFINGFGVLVWPLLVAAHQEGVPIVQKHAGIWHKEIDIYSDLFSTQGRKRMKSMERDIARYASKQVFLNTTSQAIFQKDVAPSPSSRRVIIPLPTPFAGVASKKKIGKRINIGLVARWDRIKNHQAVLALAEELLAQKIDAQIHVITNIPATPIQTRLKKRYEKIIHVIPPTDTKGVLAFFHKMDIAILTSHFDVSPTVVLEAASQGVGTLISENVGWASDYRETGNAAWIIDFSKPKAVVKKIRTLAGRTPNARLFRKWKRQHDPERVFKTYVTLFASLAK